ncbi:hypothetical protein A2U01_0024551, partial [Trifolium medium]|nr:hypothetical protein [Trifolium medium]
MKNTPSNTSSSSRSNSSDPDFDATDEVSPLLTTTERVTRSSKKPLVGSSSNSVSRGKSLSESSVAAFGPLETPVYRKTRTPTVNITKLKKELDAAKKKK